jgi:hypothetical protein
VVECDDDTYRLADDHRQALDEERQIRGELEAERRDRTRYKVERDAYREEHERRKQGEKPVRAATQVRTSTPWRSQEADGTISELIPLSSADELRPASQRFSPTRGRVGDANREAVV